MTDNAAHGANGPGAQAKTPLWPFGVGFVALTISVVLCIAAYFSPRDRKTPRAAIESQPPPAEESHTQPLPSLPDFETSYLNATAEARYVGTAACVECHSEEHESYLKTKHSVALVEVSAENATPEATIDHPPSGQTLRVDRRDGQMRHSSWFALPGGDAYELWSLPMKYVVGSGHFGHSYLAEVDGFLIQSPLTWYTPRSEWGMSPGYDAPLHQGFHRQISSGCLYCHSGRVETLGGNEFRVNLLESAIGCERCHGPGELHVARHSSDAQSDALASAEFDLTIVNPARLPRDLSEAVCQQCHLQGDVQVAVRGRSRDDYRPGLPLQDFRVDYRRRSDDGQMTIVGHVEQLHASQCYQQSETLTCITCHAPHHADPTFGAVEQSRTACLNCHSGGEDHACGLPLARRQEAENNCLTCHMPPADTEVPHVAFTHHRIGIFSGDADSTPPGSLAALEPMLELSRLSPADRERQLGLAYAQLFGQDEGAPFARQMLLQADQLLNAAHARGFHDAAVTARLAEHAWMQRDVEQAVRLAQEALQLSDAPTDERVAALRVLGEIRFRQQQFAEALEYYRELALVRRSASNWLYLGMCEQNCGNTARAIEALRQSLTIDPIQNGAHVALASIFEAEGDQELAAEHRQKSIQVGEFWQRVHGQPK